MKQEIVNLKTRVPGVATKKHPKMLEGTEFTCGVLLLPHLIAKGYATDGSVKAVKAEAVKA